MLVEMAQWSMENGCLHLCGCVKLLLHNWIKVTISHHRPEKVFGCPLDQYFKPHLKMYECLLDFVIKKTKHQVEFFKDSTDFLLKTY